MRRLLVGLVIAGTMTACATGAPDSGSTTTSPATTVVTISAGDLPPIEAVTSQAAATAPQRIVSLAMGAAETLVALGAGDRVVGRDETADVAQLHDVPVVTKGHEVSAERVLDLRPDLVIADARTTPTQALDRIRDAGVRVAMVPEAWTLADIAPRTQALADAVGADPSALLAAIPTASAAADGPRVAFLYLRGTSAVYLLGGQGSGADALIAAAGGVDVGAQAHDQPFVPLTAEAMASLDPDVLLVMTKGLESVNGVEGLVALPGVAQTSAGRASRVIAVDDEILLSFGPRTGALIERLREALRQVTS